MKRPKDIPVKIWKQIQESEHQAKITKWKRLGECAMDTAGLLIADPCYVIPDGHRSPREIDNYDEWVNCREEVLAIPFKRGHEGAGLIVHSPNGDGTVQVWGKVDAAGRVRAVFFSFDNHKPEA